MSTEKITEYLLTGGLFNPEMAIHDEVRNLLIDCRDELTTQSQLKEALEKGERLEKENDELRTKIKSHEDWIKGPPSTGSSNWSALAEKEGGK